MDAYTQFFMLVFGAIITCRSLSLLVMQWQLLTYRDSECIPRIRYQQKACDALIIIYYGITFLIGSWLLIYSFTSLTIVDTNIDELYAIPLSVSLGYPICLGLLLIVYILIRIIFSEAYDLSSYYNDMIHYRKAQEVVTEDNDQEVNFIQTYQKVITNDKWIVFWMFFILSIMIFV